MDCSILCVLVFVLLRKVSSEPSGERRKLEPTFLPTPTNITVHRGDLAVLKCHIRNLGPKVDSCWDLLIKDVHPKHAGIYLCQVTASKLYTHYVTLHVLDNPAPVDEKLTLTGTKYVNQGDTIRLMCNVTGVINMLDGVDWFFQGEPIVTTASNWRDRTNILKHMEGYKYYSELILDHSSLQDMGVYLCRGPNLKIDSIRVDVLSAGKPNVYRRGSATDASYSHASGSLSVASSYLTYSVTAIVLVLLLGAYDGSAGDELSVHMGLFIPRDVVTR